MWRHPKFQTTHYKLISSSCLAEACMLFCITSHSILKYEWPYYLWTYYLGIFDLIQGNPISSSTTFRNLRIFQHLTIIIYYFLINIGAILTFYMNSLFICDIYLTLRNPFTSYERRYLAYKWGGIMLVLLIVSSQLYDYNHGGQKIPN